MTINVAEVKRRLLVFLDDRNLVNEYIRQFGPSIDIKRIKEMKEAKCSALQSAGADGVGTEPMYELQVRCPVCNKDKVTRYELRAKSQQITQNRFLVPLYSGAPPYRTVDYTLVAVTVCPRCLFASPDKKDFNHTGLAGQGENKSQLIGNVIMTLQEKIGERKALMKSGCDCETYFNRHRTAEAAIDSYRLAVLRAKVEAWYEQPYAYYKLGAYSLRIAKITRDDGRDNREPLRDALQYFEEAFRTSNCPSEEIEMQVIYTIVALYMKLGEFKKANSYIGVFSNLLAARKTEMRENPRLNTTLINRWMDKAKLLWEDRNNEELFKEE
ncbi:MAG: DUF2225 domain-containing protein [Chitinispirillaceae bacterium]|nr:DUF2225 domain-containing protein [Chitinispirillaceae bacterium]